MNIFKQMIKLFQARFAYARGQKKVDGVVNLFDGLRKQAVAGREELLKADEETRRRIGELQDERAGYNIAVCRAERIMKNLEKLIDG